MPAALSLRRISLRAFRNYAALTWQPGAAISIITGPNGAGKTNLLEAVSLLAPGRGLRGARLGELARRGPDGDGRWAVAGRFEHPWHGTVEVATGTLPEGPTERRVFRLDGAPASQAAIAARVAMVWLTPEMARLFQEGPAGRRRFLDRLVYALEPGHARELASYETAMSGRNRLLARPEADTAWLAGIEESMARHAVAVAASRSVVLARLARILPGRAPGLPVAELALACPIAERLARMPALAVEEWLARALGEARAADREAGGALLGVHRSDLVIRDAASGAAAVRASTGQQKGLLLSVVLAHAALVAERRGFAPLLLLDEPAVHLDAARQAALVAILAGHEAQILVSGTDAEPFRPLGGRAELLKVEDGRLARLERFA
ncbi:MAG TPA: DNA replication/repair protein RecF [Acetobacteraceae bacterium]|jgi:DNA replication and repair protein RecF|nr:DNA replication/repair protein RecF [Acetobacteraceae bacterium]